MDQMRAFVTGTNEEQYIRYVTRSAGRERAQMVRDLSLGGRGGGGEVEGPVRRRRVV